MRGGEVAAEVDHDGIGDEGAAVEKLTHACGVGGGDPERAQGGVSGGGSVGAASSQAPEARYQSEVVALGRRIRSVGVE